jgi:protein-S-isoprenylcysteine O-methyltransferase Ste14
MKVVSLLAFLTMVAALVALLYARSLFAHTPFLIALQVAAVLLMLWARLSFGLRSFHAAANPTAGALVTSGPYRFLRHPIYASICLFLWAGIFDHLSAFSVSLGVVATAGAIARLLCEERFLLQQYAEYSSYRTRTKRLVPGLW